MVSAFILTAFAAYIFGVASAVALSVYAYQKQQRDGR